MSSRDSGLLVAPRNRSGRIDHYFHFLHGYVCPMVYALEGYSWPGNVGVVSVGALDGLWRDCRSLEVDILDPEEFERRWATAPFRLEPRGFDSPRVHETTPWPEVRRRMMRAFGVDPQVAPVESPTPRILVVTRAGAQEGSAGSGDRSGAARRSIPNIDAIAEALRPLGEVSVHSMEGLSLPQQMELFRSADLVVAQHGGAMANLAWCSPGTGLVEVVTVHKERVLAGFYLGLELPVAQVPQETGHSPVDPALVVDAASRLLRGEVTSASGQVNPVVGRRELAGQRTPIPWTAQAWRRHENLAIDDRDSAAWLAQLRARRTRAVPQGDAPVFVLASAWRSGSTLLQRLVMSGGDILVWGEPFGHRDPIRQLSDTFVAFRDGYPKPQHFLSTRRQSPGFSLTQDWVANMYPDVDDLVAAHRAMLDRLFAEPARAEGFSRWGVKEVRLDAQQAEYLTDLYPGARTLLLVRDPYAAFNSYRGRGGWYDRVPDRPVFDAESFAQHWRRLTASFVETAARRDDMRLIRYEDLIAQRLDLDDVGGFLGTRLDISVLGIRKRGRDDVVPSPMRGREMRVFRPIVEELAESLGYPCPE